MNGRLITILGFLLTIAIMLGCGGESAKQTSSSAQYLPETTKRSDLKRVGEIRTFVGDSLWEYIDGGAEVYHLYDFIDVTTADYKHDRIDLVADIYRFDTPLNAYGLYSVFLNPQTEIINLGVEGFLAPASINFVKGEYLIRITGFDDSQDTELALLNLAEELNDIIPGTTEKPEEFKLFPSENRIAGTDKYYAEQYMGQEFLKRFFTRDIALEPDTVTLFLSGDISGGKYLQWLSFAEQIKKMKGRAENIPYDDTLSFIIDDSYYGNIMVGLKNGKLLGLVNYKPAQIKFVADWINGIDAKKE